MEFATSPHGLQIFAREREFPQRAGTSPQGCDFRKYELSSSISISPPELRLLPSGYDLPIRDYDSFAVATCPQGKLHPRGPDFSRGLRLLRGCCDLFRWAAASPSDLFIVCGQQNCEGEITGVLRFHRPGVTTSVWGLMVFPWRLPLWLRLLLFVSNDR